MSFPQSTLGPSRAAGLVSQPRLPAALWHDRVFAWQTSLASGPPTALTDINLPIVDSLFSVFHLLPLLLALPLLVLSFSYF